eukprot:4492739-Pyramimonas_sp.AAC.1
MQALSLPWVVLGDFSIPSSELSSGASGGFVGKIGASVLEAPIEHTCVSKSGASHINYILASPSAIPCILGVQAILDAPWKLHCATVLQLRSSGEQLITRSLLLPERLPQVGRPQAQALSGPRSQARSKQIAHQALGREKHISIVSELFGDILDPASPEAGRS